MAVNPLLTSSAHGLERSLQKLDEVAARIAARTQPDSQPVSGTGASSMTAKPAAAPAEPDQIEALASLTLYARHVQAASKVVATADATLGFLLDTHA